MNLPRGCRLGLELGLLLVMAAAGAAATAAWHPDRRELAAAVAEEPPFISVAQARVLPGDVMWVDVRSAEAFAEGTVPAALSLPEAAFEECIPHVLDVWKPGATVIVMGEGASAGTSRGIARRLRGEFVLGDVRVLRGGYEAWTASHP